MKYTITEKTETQQVGSLNVGDAFLYNDTAYIVLKHVDPKVRIFNMRTNTIDTYWHTTEVQPMNCEAVLSPK